MGNGPGRNRWFMSQVHIHDLRLRNYLRRQLSHHEIHDFCQEIYLRMLDTSVQPQSSQAFLFRTARNLVVDDVRHPHSPHQSSTSRQSSGMREVVNGVTTIAW